MGATNLAFAETEPEPAVRRSVRARLPADNVTFSPRERQVVALLQTGLTRKEVAYELGLNDVTVRVHLSRAQKKSRGAR
jgi:DNA-binding NarL/FixJ family response regulator